MERVTAPREQERIPNFLKVDDITGENLVQTMWNDGRATEDVEERLAVESRYSLFQLLQLLDRKLRGFMSIRLQFCHS